LINQQKETFHRPLNFRRQLDALLNELGSILEPRLVAHHVFGLFKSVTIHGGDPQHQAVVVHVDSVRKHFLALGKLIAQECWNIWRVNTRFLLERANLGEEVSRHNVKIVVHH
jgi:hypothetical protein